MAALLTRRRPLGAAALACAVATLWAVAAAHAQTPVANFARVGGSVEVQRGARGEWQPALIGAPLFSGESVRTGADGSALLVFIDDGVLALADATTVRIARYPGGGKGQRTALLDLQQGAVEALVTGYEAEDARFEIETPSAVARVQRTRFVVRFDPATKTTDVVGLDGVVAVQGRTGLIGPGVAVGAGETTQVVSGKFPTEVQPIDAAHRTRVLAGLGGVGTGERDSLDANNPLLEGRLVPAEDRPQVAVAGTGEPYLRPTTPDEPLIWRLSPDVRANTQSLPVYRAVPPNQVPPQ